MPASQQHGFEIEKIILSDLTKRSKLAKKIPLSSSHVSRFDAPAYSDPYGLGIPTSIKTAKKNSAGNALVCLADATRIGQLTEVPQMRLLVALYEQQGPNKVFPEIREYLVTSSEWEKAMGGVSSDVLHLFNAALKVEDPKKARLVAKEWKKKLAEEHPSVMRWNAKIDSKGQRRLQCSIPLLELDALVKDPKRIRVFGTSPQAHAARLWGNGTRFPIVLSSPPRTRHPKAAKSIQSQILAPVAPSPATPSKVGP